MKNPYMSEPASVPPAVCVERKSETDRIIGLLGLDPKTQPQCVGMYGARWIGKSTLLSAVRERCEAEARDMGAVVIYLPLTDYGDREPRAFFLDFFVRLKAKGQVVEKTWMHNPTYDTFDKAITATLEKNRTLLLILDDFESISCHPGFPLDFFAFLRSIPGARRVSFITATRRPLWEPFIERDDLKGSPFPNIFHTYRLEPLGDTEARQLICNPAKGEGVFFDDDEVSQLLYLAGGFPFFLQVACHMYFELKAKTPKPTEDEVKEFAIAYQEYMRPYLTRIWEKDFRPEEHAVCRLLVKRENIPNNLQQAFATLKDYGFVGEDKNGPKLEPAVLRRFVREMEKISPTMSIWGHIKKLAGGQP